jgi:alpha-ketoglutarate-dependent 2,4-dichlorophenoxyacetate dioxygenase
MSVRINPLHPLFVGQVSGVDLSVSLDPDEVRAIDAGMDQYAVLVFHDQVLTDEQQVAFSRNFGEIERSVGSSLIKMDERRLSTDFADVSNLGKDGKVLPRDNRTRLFNLGNRLWHSDSSFRAVPSKYSLLSGRIVADQGGHTEFADMRAAYEALDEATRAIVEDLVTEHSLIYSRGKLGFTELTGEERVTFAPVRQRLVRTHPVTGRKSLYLSSHIGGIVGWPVPEALDFIRELTEHATRPAFVYSHKWRPHDLVMWDNRQTTHRVTRFDESKPRDMRRTTVAGDGPTVAQAVAA